MVAPNSDSKDRDSSEDRTNDRQRREARIVELIDAVNQLPPEEREATLRGLCGDESLVRDVLEALRVQSSGGTRTLVGPLVDTVRRAADVPEWIGRYRVLRKLSEGGMGCVYLAEQQDPLQRVAIKVIRADRESEHALHRFRVEQEALASMQHSCIARLMDCGVTNGGMPFLAMEYVDGEPVVKFCDGKRMTVQERLQLMSDVCSAVQHAHSKGVIHRDLSPNNILVKEEEGRLAAKVIDFGLARVRVDGEVTLGGDMVTGTPGYVAPEIVLKSSAHADVRSDVFSLGAILFTLLVGEPPFPTEPRDNFQEWLRRIRDEEPRRPSEIAGRMSDAEVALRGVSRKKLVAALRGDLDGIVMRSLAHDSARRYQTVDALRADILRYLRGEPVQAGPPDLGYLLRTFYRGHRRRIWVAGIAVVSVLFLYLLDAARTRYAIATVLDTISVAQEVRDCVRSFDAAVVPERSDRVPDVAAWLSRARLARTRAQADPLMVPEAMRDRLAESGMPMAIAAPLVESIRADGVLLVDLEAKLGEATGVHRWCETVRQETIEKHREAWSKVIESLAADPRYAGLVREPIEGLIPLGQFMTGSGEELWEFLFARSGKAPERGPDGQWAIEEDTGIVLVLLPGGKAWIGSDDERLKESERPRVPISLRPFLIGKYETTQGQWVRLMRENPSWDHELGRRYPVEQVTVVEAEYLGRRFGLGMPTEAQWEYACRAGTPSEWWWYLGPNEARLRSGDRALVNIASGQYDDSDTSPWVDDFEGPGPVGSFPPNPFGLHDMIGNVAEMCRNARPDGGRYQGLEGRAIAPAKWVNRGGSYSRNSATARSSCARDLARDARFANIGLRVAMLLP